MSVIPCVWQCDLPEGSAVHGFPCALGYRWGIDVAQIRSVSGCTILAYPLIRSWKYLASPMKLDKFRRLGGSHQSAIAVSFVLSGCTPSIPTLDPANMISVMNSLDFFAERDMCFARMCLRKSQVCRIMSLNLLPAIPKSLMISSILIVGSRSPRFSKVTRWNVAGEPVSPNGIHFWVRNPLLSM